MNWVANDYEWALLYDAGPYLSTDFPPQLPPTSALPADLNYYELDWVVQSADNTTITAHDGFYDYGNGYSYRWRDSNGNFYGGSGKYPSTTTLASISNPHLYLVLYGGETNNGDPDTWALPTEAITSFYPAAYAAGGTSGGVLLPPTPPAYEVTNNAFATPIVLDPLGGSLTYDNTGATGEVGDPALNDRSIWYSYTAPAGIEAVVFELSWTGDLLSDRPQARIFLGDSLSNLTQAPFGASGSGTGAVTLHPNNQKYVSAVMHVVAGQTYRLRLTFPDGAAGYWTTGTLAWHTRIWSDWIDGDPMVNVDARGIPSGRNAAVFGWYHDGGQRIYGGSSPSGIMGDTGPSSHPDYQTAIDWTSEGVFSGGPIEYVPSGFGYNEMGGPGIVRQGPEIGIGGAGVTVPNFVTQQYVIARQQFNSSTTRNIYQAGNTTFPWTLSIQQAQSISCWKLDAQQVQFQLYNFAQKPTYEFDFQWDVSSDAVQAATATVSVSYAQHYHGNLVEQGDYATVELRSMAGRGRYDLVSLHNQPGDYRQTNPDVVADNGIPNGHYAPQFVTAFGQTSEHRDFSWVKPEDLSSLPLLGTIEASASDTSDTATFDLMPLRDSSGWAVFHVALSGTRQRSMIIPSGPPAGQPQYFRSNRVVQCTASAKMTIRRRYRTLVPGIVDIEFDRLRSSGSRGVPRHWRNQTSRIAISDRVGALEAAEVARVGTRTSVLTGASGQVSVKTAKEQRGLRLGPTGRLPDNLVWPEPNPTADRPYTPP